MQRENPNLPAYQIVVDDVTGGEIANIIKGYIAVNGEKIRFKGIAYGRYGGQNVAPQALSDIEEEGEGGLRGRLESSRRTSSRSS